MAKRKSETPPAVTSGYWPAPVTRRAVATPDIAPQLVPADDAEAFWADIRDDLTFADTDRIPVAVGSTYQQQWEVIAPWVLTWNATAVDQTTNTRVAVPPPAEVGPDAFRTQRPAVTSWLVACLKWNADLNLPKKPGRTADTPAG